MTGEGLHSKSDIAAELAHRDIEIERLQARLAELELAISRALFLMQSGQVKADLRDAYDNVR